MSHLVTIETQVRDPVAVIAACARLPCDSILIYKTPSATRRQRRLIGT